MDKHSRFRKVVEEGSYWFHLHTTATDGLLEAEDYALAAKAAGTDSVIFLEHVRRNPTYDTAAFACGARAACTAQGLRPLIGFEAKLLVNGSLDISDEDLERADVVGIAEHGWSKRTESLGEILPQCFARYGAGKAPCPVVWVHPGSSRPQFRPGQAGRNEYLELLLGALASEVWVERNLKYGLLDLAALEVIGRRDIVLGGDCHTREDLKRLHENSAAQPVLPA